LLSRYTKRHNEILAILVEHISSILPSHSIFADLPEKPPVATVFHSLRPDLVLLKNNCISVIELTVCHETNFSQSRHRKLTKYESISNFLNPPFTKHQVKVITIEVSVLGLIADLSPLY